MITEHLVLTVILLTGWNLEVVVVVAQKLVLASFLSGSECKNPIVCIDEKTFGFCFVVNGQVVVDQDSFDCPEGYRCVDDPLEPCVEDLTSTVDITTTTTSTTTTEKELATTTSTTTIKIELPITSTTTTEKELATTTSTTTTEIIVPTITSTSTRTTTDATTLTTKAAADTTLPPPSCVTNNEKFPLSFDQCNTQYYQCIWVLWWWEVKRQNCPDGQLFDPVTLDCITQCPLPRENIDKEINVTESTTEDESDLVTPPAACSQSGRYPSTQCDQYYECVQVLWWWELKLITCPQGQYFEREIKNCVTIDVNSLCQ